MFWSGHQNHIHVQDFNSSQIKTGSAPQINVSSNGGGFWQGVKDFLKWIF